MVTEIVTFKVRPGTTREDVFAKYEMTAPKWRANPDLIRKNYLFDSSRGIAGGVYLWKEKTHAEKWHGPEFRKMIKELWGAEPEFQIFETPLVVDNMAGVITKA
jgi:hypothetical protein